MALSTAFRFGAWSGYGDQALAPHIRFEELRHTNLNRVTPMIQRTWIYIFRKLGSGPVELYCECHTLVDTARNDTGFTCFYARDGAGRPIAERRPSEPLQIRETMRVPLTDGPGNQAYEYAFVGSIARFSTNVIDYFCGRGPLEGEHTHNDLLNPSGTAEELFRVFRVDLGSTQDPPFIEIRGHSYLRVLDPFDVMINRRVLIGSFLSAHRDFIERNAGKLFMANVFLQLTHNGDDDRLDIVDELIGNGVSALTQFKDDYFDPRVERFSTALDEAHKHYKAWSQHKAYFFVTRTAHDTDDGNERLLDHSAVCIEGLANSPWGARLVDQIVASLVLGVERASDQRTAFDHAIAEYAFPQNEDQRRRWLGYLRTGVGRARRARSLFGFIATFTKECVLQAVIRDGTECRRYMSGIANRVNALATAVNLPDRVHSVRMDMGLGRTRYMIVFREGDEEGVGRVGTSTVRSVRVIDTGLRAMAAIRAAVSAVWLALGFVELLDGNRSRLQQARSVLDIGRGVIDGLRDIQALLNRTSFTLTATGQTGTFASQAARLGMGSSIVANVLGIASNTVASWEAARESDEFLASGYALSAGSCLVAILSGLVSGPIGWGLLFISVFLGGAGFAITTWYRRTQMQQLAAFSCWGEDQYESTHEEHRWAGGTLGDMSRNIRRQVQGFLNLVHEYSVGPTSDLGYHSQLLRSDMRGNLDFRQSRDPDAATDVVEGMPFVEIWYRPASLMESTHFSVGFALYDQSGSRVGLARVNVWPHYPDGNGGHRKRIVVVGDVARFTAAWVSSGGQTPDANRVGYDALVFAPVVPRGQYQPGMRLWVRARMILNSGGGQVPTDGRGVGIWLDESTRRSSIHGHNAPSSRAAGDGA